MEHYPSNQQQESQLTTIAANGENIPGGGRITKSIAEGFFAIKGNNLEHSISDVKNTVITDQDGEFIGAWLLTEITYWNRDKEKIVLLCGNTVIVVKYDFILSKVKYYDKIQLSKLREITSGPFALPEKSLVTQRNYSGVRLTWGSMVNEPWYVKWNPLNMDIPFTTFTSHPLISADLELKDKNILDVKCFVEELAKWANLTGCKHLQNQPITIETYVGLASYVHNQSRLGFSRDRNGISF